MKGVCDVSWMKQATLAATLLVGTTLSGCGSDNAKAERPDDPDCDDYEYDNDEGVWYCDDSSSTHSGFFYWGGSYFASRALMHSAMRTKGYTPRSKDVKSYNSKTKGFGTGSSSGFFGG